LRHTSSTLTLGLLLICSHLLHATPTIIAGKIKKATSDSVQVYSNSPFCSLSQGSKVQLEKDGSFKMSIEYFSCKEWIFKYGNETFNLYLIPGDSLYINFDSKHFDETIQFSGKGSEKNNYLASFFLKFRDFKITNKDYRKKKSMELKYSNYINLRRNNELKFFAIYLRQSSLENEFKRYALSEINYYWLSKSYLYRDKEGKRLKNNNLTDSIARYNDKLIESRSYRLYLDKIASKEFRLFYDSIYPTLDPNTVYKDFEFTFYETHFDNLTKEYLLSKYIRESLVNWYKFEQIFPYYEYFRDQYPNSICLTKVADVYDQMIKFSKGQPAPNFCFPDINGDTICLQDFKGKVVYLALWASWCSPCIAQVPYAKQLYSHFNDSVIFLYVSVDLRSKAWMSTIKKFDMSGVHLLAGGHFDSEIMKLFYRNGVPQYTLIDQQGNIAQYNAPEPRNNVKDVIQELLR